ncbi:hypothetical protein Tco_0804458 [Tanacetum coccineum]|uniref:Uncharacterized protein n=1 Tax=Tanacetum coccineum TaxID=301880 RepID=A0ABQ5A586_9ASTR
MENENPIRTLGDLLITKAMRAYRKYHRAPGREHMEQYFDRDTIRCGPHDPQNCMENPEKAFVEYASSRTNEAGEGLVSEFMASQDARLSKFKAGLKQQQSKMTNKIDTVLKAITDRIAGTLPSDTVKNLKLGPI